MIQSSSPTAGELKDEFSSFWIIKFILFFNPTAAASLPLLLTELDGKCSFTSLLHECKVTERRRVKEEREL